MGGIHGSTTKISCWKGNWTGVPRPKISSITSEKYSNRLTRYLKFYGFRPSICRVLQTVLWSLSGYHERISPSRRAIAILYQMTVWYIQLVQGGLEKISLIRETIFVSSLLVFPSISISMVGRNSGACQTLNIRAPLRMNRCACIDRDRRYKKRSVE